MKREIELSWVAGFADGEAFVGTCECTSIRCKTRGFSSIFDITQVKREAIDEVKRILGVGNVRQTKSEYGAAWSWRAYGQNALIALELVLPYLRNKHRQAELVIEFQRTKQSKSKRQVPVEVEAHRIAIHEELKVLNCKRKRLDAERLNEATPPKAEDAIVRSHGNNNHETTAEMTVDSPEMVISILVN